MASGNAERRRSSSFGRLRSKFHITNPDPSPFPRHRSQGRARHASVDSHRRTLHRSLEHGGQPHEQGHLNDDDGTVAAQYRFLQDRDRDIGVTKRSRRASVPNPHRSPPIGPLPLGAGAAEAQLLGQLIHEISQPQIGRRTTQPISKSPRKRRESTQPSPAFDEAEARAPPKLVFDALASVPHIGGKAVVENVLDLHEWMMVYQLDSMDREERDAIRARDLEDDGNFPQSKLPSQSSDNSSMSHKDYSHKTVFGVALRYISTYASTSVLLSSTSSISTPSSTISRPIEGHTLSLPILLVSTIEELYRTGLYTPSLFRLLPSPLRLRELVSVFNQRDLPRSVIVTPRPKARERGLSTQFGGSVSLHLEGVGEVGSVVSTWLGALPGSVVGVDAYINSSSRGETRKGDENGVGGWWRAVWEWCRVEEDDLSPHRPGPNMKQRLGASAIYSSMHPVPYDGTHVPNSPRQVTVSEIDKIHVAQLLLHLLPQPAFDVLVYLLAFFSQVVLVEGTNGVGVRDVGGIFGRSIFGDSPAWGGRGEGGTSGAGVADGGAMMMCWFLRRWDRISNGLFDVPQRLTQESQAQLPETRLESTLLASDHDIEASSTYTYSKGDQQDAGYPRTMEITPDVHTVPLPLSNAGRTSPLPLTTLSVEPLSPRRRVERRKEPSVERGRRRRSGTDVDATVSRRGPLVPSSTARISYTNVPERSPALNEPQEDSASVCSSYSEDDASAISRRIRDEDQEQPLARDCSDLETAISTREPEDKGVGREGRQRSEGGDQCHENVRLVAEQGRVVERDRTASVEYASHVSVDDRESNVRPRRDTEATMVESEHEFGTPKASVDEMLSDMMHSCGTRDLEPPAMGESGESIASQSHAVLLHDEPPTAAVILPLHIKRKHTAEALLSELRKEMSTESSVSGAQKSSGSVLVTTPVMELHRSESGTFSVNSTADLEARLMDVTTEGEPPFGAGLTLQSCPESAHEPVNAAVKPRILSASKPHPLERQGTVRAASKDHSPSKRRASVYELEAELQQVKEQNKQAMGALEMATRQINTLEAKLRAVDLEED